MDKEYLKTQLESLLRYSYEASPLSNMIVHRHISRKREENILQFLNQCPLWAVAFFVTNYKSPNPYCPHCEPENNRSYNEDFGENYPLPFVSTFRLDLRRQLVNFLESIPRIQLEEEFRKGNSFEFFERAYDRIQNPMRYKVQIFLHKENTHRHHETFCLCGKGHTFGIITEFDPILEIEPGNR